MRRHLHDILELHYQSAVLRRSADDPHDLFAMKARDDEFLLAAQKELERCKETKNQCFVSAKHAEFLQDAIARAKAARLNQD